VGATITQSSRPAMGRSATSPHGNGLCTRCQDEICSPDLVRNLIATEVPAAQNTNRLWILSYGNSRGRRGSGGPTPPPSPVAPGPVPGGADFVRV
jgi:hypothetical protein